MASPMARRTTRQALLLAVLALVLFLTGLGAAGLSDPDEPFYAVPAREMLQAGTWAIPLFHGQPWFDKPILFYWVVLAGYKLFGVTETAARLGSALAGVLAVLVVYLFGRRLALQARAAAAAALILATSVEFAFVARAAVTDMTLTALLTLGMLAAAVWITDGRPAPAALAGTAFGLAVLTKGPVGLLLPGVALVSYLVLARRTDRLRLKPIAAGLAGFLLAAAPWYLYIAWRYPDLLITTFIGEGNVGRFLHAEHPAFPLYYVAVLLFGLIPWSGALPGSLWEAGRPAAWRDERGPGGRAGRLYLLCWFAAVLLVFSLSASKLPTYILPAFPAAALLLGDFWAGGPGRDAVGPARRTALTAAWIGLLLAAAASGALLLLTRRPALAGTLPMAATAGILLVGGGVATLLAAWRGSFRGAILAQAGAGAATILLVATLGGPVIEGFDSIRPLTEQLEARGVSGEVAGAYRVPDVGLDYYLGRTLPRVDRQADLRDEVRADPGKIWIVHVEDVDRLRADPSLRVSVLCGTPRRAAVRLDGAGGGGGEGS